MAETSKSCYEGKTFLLARSALKQPLAVVREFLEELARSWKDRPCVQQQERYSQCLVPRLRGDGELGLLRMLLMEPYAAAHLHPRLSSLSSRSLAVPSKTDQFQSALTERVSRAILARALNVQSLFTAN